MFEDDESRNANEPGGEAGRVAEGLQRAISPKERVMRNVIGRVRPRIGSDRTDQADSPVVERAEGRDVAGDRSSDQVIVGRLVAHDSH